MNRTNERGIALVVALLLVSIMSVLAASLMFLSQTETYATMNFRMTSQARYAAESGVQAASNFLLDTSQYLPPGTNPSDSLLNYNRTVSPVTYNGNPVILSAVASKASNYPVSAVQTAFNTAAKGTMMAGNQTINYGSYATLVSMQQFDSYGGQPIVVQTWQITSDGTLGGSRKATVEVSGFVERPKVSANSYALFATANTCSAIDLKGNINIDSYDSSIGPPSTSTTESGGNMGTNGNGYVQGSVSVQGNLYTPRTGVGTCTTGAVDALTTVGAASVNGSIVQLPAAVSYPLPLMATTPPTNTVTVDSTLLANASTACSSLGLSSGTNCTVNAAAKTLTIDGKSNLLTLPSVVVTGGYTLILNGANPPNIIELNSFTGSGNLEVDANLTSPNQNQSVVLKVAGKNPDGTDMTTAFDLSTMSWKQNTLSSNYDASTLQINYAGSQTIAMSGGNSQSAATIYAPNAHFVLQGTQDLYGSVLAATVYEHGNAGVHYDKRLLRDFYVPGHAMAGTFTWKSF